MSSPTPESFLMGSGVKPAAFKALGDTCLGKISEKPYLGQQTDYKTKEPLFWDNGDPRMQLLVTLETTERDPSDPEDDGSRRLYVKGNLQQVIAAAVRAAGGSALSVGDTLEVAYVGDNPTTNAKLYSANYTPAATGFLATTAAPEQPTPPPAAPPAAPAPAAAAGAGGAVAAEHLALAQQLIAAGLPDAVVLASAPSLTPEVLAALRTSA